MLNWLAEHGKAVNFPRHSLGISNKIVGIPGLFKFICYWQGTTLSLTVSKGWFKRHLGALVLQSNLYHILVGAASPWRYPTLTVFLLLLLSLDAHALLHIRRSVSARALHCQSFCNWCRITWSPWEVQSHWACSDCATCWQAQERTKGVRDTACVTASWLPQPATKQRKWILDFIQPVRTWITIYFSGEEHNWVMDMSGKRTRASSLPQHQCH